MQNLRVRGKNLDNLILDFQFHFNRVDRVKAYNYENIGLKHLDNSRLVYCKFLKEMGWRRLGDAANGIIESSRTQMSEKMIEFSFHLLYLARA